MTSKERVLAVFRHEEPDKVPCWFGSAPEFWLKLKGALDLDDEGLRLRMGDDFRRVFSKFIGPQDKENPEATYRTPFGIDRFGLGYGQPLGHPLFDATLSEVHEYPWPDPDWIDDLAADDIDIFFIGNDFGSQTGPLVGVELFERFLAPHLKRLTELGHDYGLPVMMHCCGGFKPLIPSMIVAGLDGLHALQPTCHDMVLPDLKREFGDKIVLNGGVDSHHILIEGEPSLVRKKTREAIDILKPGGGCIISPSHDYVLEETPTENVLAMYEEIAEYGSY